MPDVRLQHKDVVLIDYGVGNHLSITHALSFLGYRFLVSNRKDDVERASSYILPGVGTFGEAMTNLHRLGIIETLRERVLVQKRPLLGICLGMQILAEDSQEKGSRRGLGWIKGHVVKVKGSDQLRVPHVGWNDLRVIKKNPLFARTNSDPYFYFDHSYHFECEESAVAATCRYGEDITAAVQQDNIFGVQFHPEKSQNNGLKLFRGFFNYVKAHVAEMKLP